jgi:hypothetical protein
MKWKGKFENFDQKKKYKLLHWKQKGEWWWWAKKSNGEESKIEVQKNLLIVQWCGDDDH